MKYHWIIILLLAGLTAWSLVRQTALKREARSGVENAKKREHLLYGKICQLVEDKHIDLASGVKVKDQANHVHALDSLVAAGGAAKLVFRFTEDNCSECFRAELGLLEEIGRTIGSNNIILLVSYSGANDLALIRKQYGISFPLYNIPATDLKADNGEIANFPYYFVLDSNIRPGLVFFPEKSMPGLTRRYFLMVKEHLGRITDLRRRELSINLTGISFEKTTYDLGEVKKGESYHASFRFKNTGASPLIIKRVEAECGCTEPEYAQDPVLPGDTSSIDIVYRARAAGMFKKQVTVYTNSSGSPVKLFIHGRVQEL